MKDHDAIGVRTIAIVGPPGAGKTTLVEAMAVAAGARTRKGTIEEGTTLSDRMPEERAHHHSIRLNVTAIEHNNAKLNIIDVPGIAEFHHQLHLGLDAATLALLVVPAAGTIGHEVRRLWQLLEERSLPRIVLVNKCDRENADFDVTVSRLRTLLSPHIDPVELPLFTGDHLEGIVDVLTNSAFKEHDHRQEPVDLPDTIAEVELHAHDSLLDEIVQGNDNTLERYLSGEQLSETEISEVFAAGVAQQTLFPLLCGSATSDIGIIHLLDLLVQLTPAPMPTPELPTVVEAIVTEADQYQGKVTTVVVLQGTLRSDQVLRNVSSGHEIRMHNLTVPFASGVQLVSRLTTGDIATVAKAALASGEFAVDPAQSTWGRDRALLPPPSYSMALITESTKDDERCATELAHLIEEDPALRVSREPGTHRICITGVGATHLGLTIERLRRQTGAKLSTAKPETQYQETLSGRTTAEGRYKKQTGGHGQYGVVTVVAEPIARGSGIVFIDEIVGGAVPRPFISAVEKGIRETATNAGRFGYPLTDCQIRLIDGKYHSVDSSELSFKMAGSLALKAAVEQIGTLVLEPITQLNVRVPNEFQGDTLGYLTGKRGKIHGTRVDDDGSVVEINAEVPHDELHRLILDLQSLTAGAAELSQEHARYEPVPESVLKQKSNA
ncbi:MAG: elongation factor G [Ferrimicrobium sp.]